MLQEDAEQDGNKLASVYLVCNDIYTSTGWPKSSVYTNQCKRKTM